MKYKEFVHVDEVMCYNPIFDSWKVIKRLQSPCLGALSRFCVCSDMCYIIVFLILPALFL